MPRCREYNRPLAEERGLKDRPKVFSLQFTGSPLGRGAHITFTSFRFFTQNISKCCTVHSLCNVILAHHEIYSYLTTAKLCTKVLELPQFCAAALGLKQCRVFSSLSDHTLFLLLFSFPKDTIFHSYFLQDTTRTVYARTRALPAHFA